MAHGSPTQETLVKVQDNVDIVLPTLVKSENTVWTYVVNVSEKKLLTLVSTNTDKLFIFYVHFLLLILTDLFKRDIN